MREHAGAKCRTLADYRVRHAQYKSDHDFQAAHLVAPWLVAFEDHEIENNWAGPASSSQAPEFRDAGAVPHARVHQPPGRPRQGLGGVHDPVRARGASAVARPGPPVASSAGWMAAAASDRAAIASSADPPRRATSAR